MRKKNTPSHVEELTFAAAAERIKNKARNNLKVRFQFKDYEGRTRHRMPMRASQLYRDWYGDCDACPPNDTEVSKIHITLLDEEYTSLTITDSVPFEQLMEAIEQCS